MSIVQNLSLTALKARYRRGDYSPTAMVRDLFATIRQCPDEYIWTTLLDEETCLSAAAELEKHGDAAHLPLFGIPFSVKDNIDTAGINTSCSCDAFQRMPDNNAEVVQRAIDAGAILIGKNSLDQFATGLSGTRVVKPHCKNPFKDAVIPGGSSSGSGVAVARGLVTFAIGTDTGGSGRIPAAMNNIVGIKPTLGTLSDNGVVHNSRFLDTTSVFAQTVAEGQMIYAVLQDPGSTVNRLHSDPLTRGDQFNFCAPDLNQLDFFGDKQAEKAFAAAISTLESIGGTGHTIDLQVFAAARSMPFDSGLLAERHFNYGSVLASGDEALHPALKSTLQKAAGYSRDDLISALYRMKDLRASAHKQLGGMDCLVLPTVARSFTCDEIKQDPVTNNHKIGHYTYFVNPLDLCAVAVPAAIKPDGVPFGISLIGLPGTDATVQSIGRRFQDAVELKPGIDAISI
ncbi:amidase [Natronospirillum operosum]|uniref:Amidase n=1 Tax=Natronospirillum operosum TaxID=2759953 RepID=A0A4Z0WEK4_9GAMM|nr:amidase family protein [Natronospirillum operosum]TGG93556.1 amidase [Natronospirillum operosum]